MYKDWIIVDRLGMIEPGEDRYEIIRSSALTDDQKRELRIAGSYDTFLDANSEAMKLEAESLRRATDTMIRSNPRMITRSGYTRTSKSGKRTRVKPTKIRDIGRKGKTPASRKWAHFEEGALKGWKASLSQKKRLKILSNIISKTDYATVIRRLNQLANVNPYAGVVHKARSDMLALMKKHRPDMYEKTRKEFKAKTKSLLKTKTKAKRKNPKKKCPGGKIRSKGKGKGLGVGKGKGPVGKPSKRISISIPESSFKTLKALEDSIYKNTKKISPYVTREWARKMAKKIMKQKKKQKK